MKYLAMLKKIPRTAAISLAVIAGDLVFFLIVFIFLGDASDRVIAENASLKQETAQMTKNLSLSQDDFRYILQNQEKFESILQTDRLVPHTRLNAIRQLQELAHRHNLGSLNYAFAAVAGESAASVKSQPASGGYKVSVESITLRVGAPLDTDIYGLMLDLGDSFPGSAVVQNFTLNRVAEITPDVLEHLSRGQGTDLVTGDMRVIWRTAQAVEPEGKKK